jgi:putative ABC transport system ATP-binding protein
MEELAVKCTNLTKSYHVDGSDTPALRGVTLAVKRGELMMLVGPSGCGKTTLLSVIAGILDHDSGECIVEGNNLAAMKEPARSRLRGRMLGFVFQAYNLIPTLTAAENVAVPLLIAKTPWDEAIERAEIVLGSVGLKEKVRALPRNLSGGQQQRVAIARALVHEPSLIVCDEPTSALDQDTGHRVMELFREVALSHNRTLLIVTHDSRIFSFADRLAHMNDGQIIDVVDARSAT